MVHNHESTPHEHRTAGEPRQSQLHAVTVSSITPVNDKIRKFRLSIDDRDSGLDFSPGQWLDVHFAGLDRAGGYTIISTPRAAEPRRDDMAAPYVELAVQAAPTPQVQRLWAPEAEVLGTKLQVRVGGSFVWPPAHVHPTTKLGRALMIAGGVGINPLISMVSHMHETDSMPPRVDFIYTTRVDSSYGVDRVLALPELLSISSARPGQFRLHLFCSGHPSRGLMDAAAPTQTFEPRRLIDDDVLTAIGTVESRNEMVTYVCGPPQMTDHIVGLVKAQEGVIDASVLCEKWW